jgi:hypothetical protein
MPFVTSTSRARTLAALAPVLGTLLLAAGCYNPNIGEKFICNDLYEPNAGQCPDGFHCENHLCLKGPPRDGGSDVGAVTHPDAPIDSTSDLPAESAPDTPQMCNMPVAGCSADTSKGCDPVCQVGCTGCHQKCSVTTSGAPTCNEPPADSPRPRGLLEGCNPVSSGAPQQTDDCAPGLVCLADHCGARCYHFCKTDNDCGPMTPCSKDAGGGVKVCDLPFMDCNAAKGGMDDGCGTPSDNITCFLSMTQADRTFCDCSSGGGRPNTACTTTADCIRGLVCAGSAGSAQCRQVCDLSKGSADCQFGTGMCTPLNGGTKFGYCN